jgi:putative ABC transport system permease protein
MTLVLRTASDPTRLLSPVRHILGTLDKDQPITAIKTMDQYIDELASRPHLSMNLVGLFAVLATVLATIGIYGVMSYTANQQVREIGIRMALGAQQGDVLRLMVGHGISLALIGISLGLVVGLGLLPRVIAAFLYGVTFHDPLAVVGAAILLLCVAFAACFVPARRASKIDPLTALHYE